MRVILVNPPKTGWERDEIAPPLGLLRIAAVAQEVGSSVAIEDFNLLYHLIPELSKDFYRYAVERLLALNGDVYGFTSMAVDSHVALEMARRLKAERPDIRTVFGGVHFSSLGMELIARFPWVDEVIAGEGEAPFGAFLRGHQRKLPIREMNSVQSVSAAYSLVQLPAYFHVNPNHVINFEAGRGCKYKCTFCYSPRFYGAMRDFGVDHLVQELTVLRNLGAKKVFFVGDNFLNDRAWAEHLCAALEEARLGISWYCYATLPDLNEQLANSMARAGCKQVFMGIDVVGRESQRHFHKAFLRRDQDLGRKLRALLDMGICPTCGFILCPPSHPGSSDWESTIAAAVNARLFGADVLFNALNLYWGTEAFLTNSLNIEADDLQAKLLLDVPSVVQENPLAVAAPGCFPFHSRYVDGDEWRSFLFLTHCLHTLVNSYPNILKYLLDSEGSSPIKTANAVLGHIGDLMAYEAVERRRREQTAAIEIFQNMPIAASLPEWKQQTSDNFRDTFGQSFW